MEATPIWAHLQQNQTLDPSPTLKGNFQKLLPANSDENFLIKMES